MPAFRDAYSLEMQDYLPTMPQFIRPASYLPVQSPLQFMSETRDENGSIPAVVVLVESGVLTAGRANSP